MLATKTTETAVGLFIALGIGALLVLAMRVSNLTMASVTGVESYVVEARFDNIGGLKVRAPVKMAGVVIGRVADISVDLDAREAVVLLSIYDAFDRIPADSSAVIYTAGLLGEQYVGIQAGVDESYLENGGQITLTQSAVVLEEVIGRVLYNRAAGDK
jgi:phospholipid/cholesterol/gamma-HCH transport system substrate-binding protein